MSAQPELTPASSAEARIPEILRLLHREYPGATCELNFKSPLELLVATILSAQCTDERVNKVTPALFATYPTAQAYAEADIEGLQEAIHSTGFFRNKAKNIQAACRILAERFGGGIPVDLEVLVQLPGIGRKTANVILGNAYGIQGIVVDTHVGRVAQRLGLSANKDPDKIEQDLMAIIPRERWIKFSHQLIQHGRSLCQARKPKTDVCPLRPHCDHAEKHG